MNTMPLARSSLRVCYGSVFGGVVDLNPSYDECEWQRPRWIWWQHSFSIFPLDDKNGLHHFDPALLRIQKRPPCEVQRANSGAMPKL